MKWLFVLTAAIVACCTIYTLLSPLPKQLIVVAFLVMVFHGVGLLLSSPEVLFAPLAWLVGRVVKDDIRDRDAE